MSIGESLKLRGVVDRSNAHATSCEDTCRLRYGMESVESTNWTAYLLEICGVDMCRLHLICPLASRRLVFLSHEHIEPRFTTMS